MKKLFLILLILLFAISAWAAPFLVSDPSPTAIGGRYEIQENGVTIMYADNQTDGSIKADLEAVPVGLHNYKVRYVVVDPVWGSKSSAYVPFTFTKPSLATGSLSGLKLAP